MKKECNKIPTLVKWAGGKKQLIRQFEPLFPKKIKRYIEPFVGGGAVAFYILKNHPEVEEVILSDVNKELINTYRQVKNNVDELIFELKKLKKLHNKETYYKIRKEDPKLLSNLTAAARFIYLNKTCFNGIYRVNKKGEFNVPIGSYKNPRISDENSLREISRLLKGVKLKVGSFEAVENIARKGDFIYFDPPYYPIKKNNSFTSYTKDNFLEEDHKKLFNLFKKLDKRGCRLMLSNSDASFIEELYSYFAKKGDISKVKATRMINCDATKRGAVSELVIRNWSN